MIFLKIARIISKALSWFCALTLFLGAYYDFLIGVPIAALPTLFSSVLIFIFVLKDHSEDKIRKIAARVTEDDKEKIILEEITMILSYLLSMLLWIFAVVIEYYLN